MADSSSELHLEIETLERKHAENPEGRFFVPLANAYRKMGDLETAEALLRSGVERHPDYLSAHIVLGRCLADREDLGGAEEEFRYVLSRDPQNLIALRTLGEIAAADGRPAEAAEWYGELLAVDPMNEEARQALGTLSLTREADAEPAESGSWWNEPDSLRVEGEVDDPSVEDPEVEPAFSSPAPEVVTETIAELYTRQGLHDRAAEVYRELLRRRGDDAVLAERLAEVERLARGEPIEDEGEADPFAASVVDGLADVDMPSAELPVEEAAGAPSITDFLTRLVAWRSDGEGGGVVDEVPSWAAGEAEETAGSVWLDGPAADVGDDAGGDPWLDALSSEPVPGEAVAELEFGEAAGDPLDDLSFLEPAAGETAPPTPTGEVFRDAVDDGAPAAPPAREDAAEDEDLESFQAWLRSLKR